MIAQTVQLSSHPDKPIFIVFGLTDRAFNAGFRVLNPEFKATIDQVTQGSIGINEFIENNIESSDVGNFHNYKKNTPMNPKQRAIWREQTR